MPRRDGTGPSRQSTGPRDGRGRGRGAGRRSGHSTPGIGKKTGGKKGSCE